MYILATDGTHDVELVHMKLHEKVAALRKLKNKTQKQMADFIGIGVTAYSNKETGKRKFTIEELEKIASFLGEKITIFF